MVRTTRFFVTGAAGFIGSHVVDRLLSDGHEVVGFDNFTTGQERFLEKAAANPRFRLIRGDIVDRAALADGMAGAEVVFHFAANADVRFGLNHPGKDLEQNTIGTANVLEAMRAAGVRRITFSSTGSVYGDSEVFPTPEDAPFPVQTSLYGASKLAGESLIEAYCEGYGFQGCIFRFVSILGERYSHGHVFDFCKSLLNDPSELRVLGNGLQRKSYLYVEDCVDIMMLAVTTAASKVNIFNLGTDEYCSVNDSIGWITETLGVSPRLSYTGEARGWVGDNPFIFLDCSRARGLGWAPKLSIRDAVIRTVHYLLENRWLFVGRAAEDEVSLRGVR